MACRLVTELFAFTGFVIAVGIGWYRVKKIDAMILETSPVVGSFMQRLIIETVPTFTLNVKVTGWCIGFTSLWIDLSGRTIHGVNRSVAGSDKHAVSLDFD